jgi:restriction endonuclease Mrr
MPLPDYPNLLVPVLEIIKNRADHKVEEIRAELKVIPILCDVRPEEFTVKQKNGGTVFVSHVAWALAQLNMAKAVPRTQKGIYQITDQGLAILRAHPSGLSVKELRDL